MYKKNIFLGSGVGYKHATKDSWHWLSTVFSWILFFWMFGGKGDAPQWRAEQLHTQVWWTRIFGSPFHRHSTLTIRLREGVWECAGFLIYFPSRRWHASETFSLFLHWGGLSSSVNEVDGLRFGGWSPDFQFDPFLKGLRRPSFLFHGLLRDVIMSFIL